MTVAELIANLQNHDASLPVFCYDYEGLSVHDEDDGFGIERVVTSAHGVLLITWKDGD